MEKKIQGTFIAIRRLSLLMLITIVMPTDASDYCCEFEDEKLCFWRNQGPLYWMWSGVSYPNTTGIDDFNTTDPSQFQWLQPFPTGEAAYISTSVTLDENDVISIELYRRTSSPLNKLSVSLTRTDFLPQTILNDLTPGWLNQSVTCGPSGPTQCCVTYPCKGWFKVEGKINENELLAFKNFLINGCPIGTTTPLPPTEPPSDADVLCNRFQSSNTDWVLGGWAWSRNLQPDWADVPVEFTYDSDYAWCQNYDAAKLTSPSVKVDESSEISFDYYVYSSIVDIGNSLIVYFHDADADVLNPLTILQDTKGNWTTTVTQCSSSSPCCEVYPCSGKLIWEASQVTNSSVLYAVDNLQLNQGCSKSSLSLCPLNIALNEYSTNYITLEHSNCANMATCCEFEVSSICDMDSSNSLNSTTPTDGWIWSGQQEPDQPVPPSDGNFVWREDVIRTEGTPETATLQSQLVTLYPNSSIDFSYFVTVGIGGINRLYIRFHRQIDDLEVTMDYLSVNSATWIPYNVKCQSAHANCCIDEIGCTGWMEFTTVSDGTHPVIFAIDNLQVDSQCSA